jgi:hypothetical protein
VIGHLVVKLVTPAMIGGAVARQCDDPPTLRPSEGDLLAEWPPLWPGHHLKSSEALEKYLEAGFPKVASICGRPGRQARQETDELITRDQVFVGGEIRGGWEAAGGPVRGEESLESIVHGLNEKARGDKPDSIQLGSANPRQPSPMTWRLFSVSGKAARLRRLPHRLRSGRLKKQPGKPPRSTPLLSDSSVEPRRGSGM